MKIPSSITPSHFKTFTITNLIPLKHPVPFKIPPTNKSQRPLHLKIVSPFVYPLLPVSLYPPTHNLVAPLVSPTFSLSPILAVLLLVNLLLTWPLMPPLLMTTRQPFSQSSHLYEKVIFSCLWIWTYLGRTPLLVKHYPVLPTVPPI